MTLYLLALLCVCFHLALANQNVEMCVTLCSVSVELTDVMIDILWTIMVEAVYKFQMVDLNG